MMISRWVNGTAAAVAAVTLLACGGGGPDSSTGPDGVTVLPSGAVSLAAGQSTPLTAKTALKIDAGSTGSENVLVLVDTGLTSIATKTTYQVTATGIGAAGAISPPATSLAFAPAAAAAAALSLAPTLDVSYGMRLNSRYRSRFRGGLRAARAAYNASLSTKSGVRRSLSAAPPAVGDIVTVNVGDDACSNLQPRGTRVVAVGTQSIVLADTTNPSGGFTAAQYQRFAARFDTLVYPLDMTNFGAPTDIDKNSKVILLFTGAVNALTPPKSTSYVGGFFFGRDLFPTDSTPEFGPGCAGSNYGEMFYLLAPDPTGAINGNPRPTDFVDSVTTSVIAHEFQHLINASRRMYITANVQDFEENWLDEGLAHVAEELLFYRESGLTPRSNITLNTLKSTNTIRYAFNRDQSSNTGRYGSFLEAPSDNSPFRGDDSLETRGATWNLLRYLADRKAGAGTGSDAATWYDLVNTARVGIANLGGVFGSDLAARVRDWNVSHYTDDLVAGAASEYQQPSWNYHDIYPGLQGGGAYPLKVTSLETTGASGSLIGGAAAYYRFSIPAGTTANITLSAPGPVSARVVRVR